MGLVKTEAKHQRPFAMFPTMSTATLATPSGTFVLWPDRVGNAKTDEIYPVAGASGAVETSGTVRQRIGLLRTTLTGGLGVFFPKKIDDRRLYVTVSGPRFVWVVELPTKRGAESAARVFVAQLEQAARQSQPA